MTQSAEVAKRKDSQEVQLMLPLSFHILIHDHRVDQLEMQQTIAHRLLRPPVVTVLPAGPVRRPCTHLSDGHRE